MISATSAAEARAAFPNGLEQPPASFRFGADALLLAAWAARQARGPCRDVAELGSGCGAALFALLLQPGLSSLPSRLLGLDVDEELCQAARRNALRLGFADRCAFVCGDLRDRAIVRSCGLRQFDLVLANPPFHAPGCGRTSAQPRRDRAVREPLPLAGHAALLRDFCAAAAALLRHHGRFFCIFPARDISRLLSALRQCDLGLRALLPVQARADAPALRVLVEARRQAADDCCLLPPLVLHASPGSGGPDWTDAAREFCPRLTASARCGPMEDMEDTARTSSRQSALP